MNVLFIHQNFPGQFRHPVNHFASIQKDNMKGRLPLKSRNIAEPSRSFKKQRLHFSTTYVIS